MIGAKAWCTSSAAPMVEGMKGVDVFISEVQNLMPINDDGLVKVWSRLGVGVWLS
jgi:hypothetical protein